MERGKHSEETKKKISESLHKYYNTNVVTKILKKCKTCGKEFSTYTENQNFCSSECYNVYRTQLKIDFWLKGDEIYNTQYMPLFIKNYLFKIHNSKCQKCGWGNINKHTNKVPLQIHHIDGDCTNNSEDNLELLCPNCHALTENFGSSNKNSKRLFRRQKLYSEEK